MYSKNKCGIGRAGGPAEFFYSTRGSWSIALDGQRVQLIVDALNAADRNA